MTEIVLFNLYMILLDILQDASNLFLVDSEKFVPRFDRWLNSG